MHSNEFTRIPLNSDKFDNVGECIFFLIYKYPFRVICAATFIMLCTWQNCNIIFDVILTVHRP